MSKIPHRLYLTEDQMPQKWFNLRSAMAEQPDPLLHQMCIRDSLYGAGHGTGQQTRVLRQRLQPVSGGAVLPRCCDRLACCAAPHQIEGGVQPGLHIPENIVQMCIRDSP